MKTAVAAAHSQSPLLSSSDWFMLPFLGIGLSEQLESGLRIARAMIASEEGQAGGVLYLPRVPTHLVILPCLFYFPVNTYSLDSSLYSVFCLLFPVRPLFSC